MTLDDHIVLALYLATMALLAVYGAHRFSLLARFRWRDEAEGAPEPAEDAPRVTVQLPVYDERTVAARLIRAAGALRYPRERLELQVLDDSDDETCAIVDEEVRRLVERGVDAVVLRRGERRGFKAGALDHGLARAKGELLCIFDADFEPPPDFLERLVPRFRDPRVGMVQARWDHANRDESALTRAEATLLDGHFVIEHTVRHARGFFFNFNGTAGIWRRAAIEAAGGWQHDTLTEDLDLSYRAQLAGWRFSYAPLVAAPAELPPDIAAFKSQQHRWAKGSAQVARKLGRRLATADAPWRVRLEAFLHLGGNVGYPCLLMLALLLPLMLELRLPHLNGLYLLLFVLCTVSALSFYARSQRALGRSAWQRTRDTTMAIALGIGMCVSQTHAVLTGFLPGTGRFERTPKRGDAPRGLQYRALRRGLPGVELLLAAWFAWALVGAVRIGAWMALPFLLLFFAGFAWVGTLSVAAWARR